MPIFPILVWGSVATAQVHADCPLTYGPDNGATHGGHFALVLTCPGPQTLTVYDDTGNILATLDVVPSGTYHIGG